MNLQLGQKVYHRDLYYGRELFEIVGIRKTEVELEGDWSGGTHPVWQKDWMPIEGVILPAKKICPQKIDGSCPLHNLFCAYPRCEEQ